MGRSARVPLGLLGMLPLILAGERLASRDDLAFTNLAADQYKFAGRASRRVAGCDLLCFGDSLVKDGVIPSVIAARLGRPTYNLAIAGGVPPASYFLLRRALESGARPSLVLVDFKSNILRTDPRLVSRCLAPILTLRERLDFAWTARDPDAFAGLTVGRLFPSVAARGEIRTRVLSALAGGPGADWLTLAAHRRNWNVNAGTEVQPRNPYVMNLPEFWNEKDCLIADWWCDPINAVYVARFLGLAKQYQIPVVWLLPPIHPRVQGRRDQLGLDLTYDRFLRAVQGGSRDILVIDGRHSGYTPSLFTDASHLDRDGARAFSDGVGSLLGRPGALEHRGEGWADLPSYRKGPGDSSLEDVRQSRLALADRLGAIR
jgi:hypothetical protein